MAKKRGYVASLVGCAVGGIVLGIAGFAGGVFYVDRFMPYAELEGILPPLFGTVAGAALGAGFGSWVSLRIRGYKAALTTGFLVAAFVPFLLIAGAVAGDRVGDALGVGSNGFVLWMVALVVALAAGLGARLLVVLGSGSDWDAPPES
jgi:hypothetical protein